MRAAVAETVSFTWAGTMQFQPNQVIPGGTVGGLFAEFYGTNVAASGSVPVSGRITYTTATFPTVQNNVYIGIRDAISEMTLTLGPVTVAADFPRIAIDPGSSGYVGFAGPRGGFCSSVSDCRDSGIAPGPGWGNAIIVASGTSQTTGNERDTRRLWGDGMMFGVGNTRVAADFTPSMTTSSYGQIAVDSVSLIVRSQPGQRFLNRLAFPHMRELVGTPAIERTVLTIRFEIPGLPNIAGFSGFVEQIAVDP